ncbi:MAG: 50S ribosomal protein L9 [Actinomycetota bacterium]|nr:50S ribosomal protein L9 [Actinomycetota bacterium]MDI6822626.1 50S ribosomal protein L9 [Actinomycetota bacterium]
MKRVKIILRKDIETLGNEGDVVEVAPGYARNFLIPQGLAVEATEANIQQLEIQRSALARKEAQERAEWEEIAKRLEGQSIEILMKAGREGRLYGAVTAKDIAEAISKQKEIALDKRKVVLDEPIKFLGTYPITLKIYPNIEAKINLQVTGEGESHDEDAG